MLADAGKPPRERRRRSAAGGGSGTAEAACGARRSRPAARKRVLAAGPRTPPRGSSDLYAFPNWSLLSHHINIGIALAFISTPVVTYLVERRRTRAPRRSTAYSAVTYLPWCLKIFFGLQSDLVPFCGMHRRSYYLAHWAVFIAVQRVAVAPLGEPSVNAVLLLCARHGDGPASRLTVADAIILECAKFEPPLRRAPCARTADASCMVEGHRRLRCSGCSSTTIGIREDGLVVVASRSPSASRSRCARCRSARSPRSLGDDGLRPLSCARARARARRSCRSRGS